MDITANLITATANMQRLGALRTQREATTERLEAAQAELTRLQKARSAALLDRTDTEVDAFEASIEKAERAVARETDRIKALDAEIAALNAQSGVLNADQSLAVVQGYLAKAKAARAAGEKIVLEHYPKAAKRVADLLVTLTAIERFIQEVNEMAAVAGLDKSMLVPAVNAARARPDVVIDAHDIVEEVHDLERQPVRVSGGDFTSIVSTDYPTKTVKRHVPREVITYRPPHETLDGTCLLPPARDGELPYWAPNGAARREAIANAEAIVDAAIK